MVRSLLIRRNDLHANLDVIVLARLRDDFFDDSFCRFRGEPRGSSWPPQDSNGSQSGSSQSHGRQLSDAHAGRLRYSWRRVVYGDRVISGKRLRVLGGIQPQLFCHQCRFHTTHLVELPGRQISPQIVFGISHGLEGFKSIAWPDILTGHAVWSALLRCDVGLVFRHMAGRRQSGNGSRQRTPLQTEHRRSVQGLEVIAAVFLTHLRSGENQRLEDAGCLATDFIVSGVHN